MDFLFAPWLDCFSGVTGAAIVGVTGQNPLSKVLLTKTPYALVKFSIRLRLGFAKSHSLHVFR